MSEIQWTDRTWNPVRGCSRVSSGCDHCYAMGQAHRFDNPGGAYEGLTRVGARGVDWSGEVRLIPEKLDEPLRWRKPRRVFVNSMSDLFHHELQDYDIAEIWARMAAAEWHTFQVLTKRADRLPALLNDPEFREEVDRRMYVLDPPAQGPSIWRYTQTWPLPNIWLGVSAEDQQRFDERAPDLIATPAAVRFLSLEPLLGPIDMGDRLLDGIDWVIVGGESGRRARPCDAAWIRSIRDQCREAGTAVFCKQLGARPFDGTFGHDERGEYEVAKRWTRLRDSKGGDPAEWPADLRVREFPA